jgi:hypothetical protein
VAGIRLMRRDHQRPARAHRIVSPELMGALGVLRSRDALGCSGRCS